MKNWYYIALGAIALLAFNLLGSSERKVKKLKGQRDELILEGSGRAKAKAHQLGIKADKHQLNALEAEKVGKSTVDKVGTQSETVSSILDSWRKPDSV